MEMIFECVPAFHGGGKREIFSCNNQCQMVRIQETTEQEFLDYVDALQKNGFEIYDSCNIKNNRFITLMGKGYLLQVYFTACDKVTRVIADPNVTLYKREPEKIEEKICDTTLYQFELDYRTINCGMCYITQCEDGSFFVVDSAHMNSVNDHIRIYDQLKRLNGDREKITIAGWFFTHAHQDHIAKFMDFIEADFKNCEIEMLYYNFPELTVKGAEQWSDSDKQTMREFDALVEKHQELKVVKLHTGEHFYVRNLEFRVLATHEDMYPETLACYNNSSAILQMIAGGCKVMFLGDANTEECEILIRRYGDELKSDIVQVAHHGYNGDNVDVYHYVNAKVALYSNRRPDFEQIKNLPSNSLILSLSKEIYLAEDGTTAFTLPYQDNTAIVFPKEITP